MVYFYFYLFYFLLKGVWIFHLIDLNVLSYDHGQYVFPKWTQILGWAVIAFILAAIPLFSIVAICQANGKSIIKVIKEKKLACCIS